jgi:hypothetical protein
MVKVYVLLTSGCGHNHYRLDIDSWKLRAVDFLRIYHFRVRCCGGGSVVEVSEGCLGEPVGGLEYLRQPRTA